MLLAGSIPGVYGQKPDEQAKLDAFQYEKGIVYKTINGKKLDLIYFKPQNLKPGTPAPWMLFVHGGGWRGGDKYNVLRSAFSGTLKELTENGIACFTIEYRLTRNHITAYDSVVDCKDAARFLLKNAETYNLDPEHYGVWGGSAGGHLSLMTALGKDEDFIGDKTLTGIPLNFKCVASYYPLTSLVNPDVLVGSKFEDPAALLHVLDGPFTEKPKLAHLLSPTEYLTKNSPPILLLHGDKDTTLSINNSLYMLEVAKQKGADVELLTVKNAGHSFGGKNINPSMEKINEMSSRFIISKLTGKLPIQKK
jgi:acetyl esterase/lipase